MPSSRTWSSAVRCMSIAPPLPRGLREQPRLERRLAGRLDAIGRRTVADGDDLDELRPEVVDADAVVGGDSGRKPAGHELRVDRSPPLLAVVVRARAAGKEAESVPHP